MVTTSVAAPNNAAAKKAYFMFEGTVTKHERTKGPYLTVTGDLKEVEGDRRFKVKDIKIHASKLLFSPLLGERAKTLERQEKPLQGATTKLLLKQKGHSFRLDVDSDGRVNSVSAISITVLKCTRPKK